MWSFFILGPAVVGVASAISSLTGGMNFVAVAMAVLELQRRRGYKPEEGQFTERAGNNYYAVCFDTKSDYDLNRDLGRTAEAVPSHFESLAKFKFDMTKSEGEMLRALLMPVIDMLDKLDEVKSAVVNDNDLNRLDEIAKQLIASIIPLQVWLAQFPRKKVL
jgi:hypothetical protein